MNMKKFPIFLLLINCLTIATVQAKDVTILNDDTVPQVAYAARKLGEALAEQGHNVRFRSAGYEYTNARRKKVMTYSDYDYLVSLGVHSGRMGAEAFAII